MSALSFDDVGAAPGRTGGGLSLKNYVTELCLIVLIALTAAIIGFQHQIFGRDIVIDPKTAARFPFSGYADGLLGGKSSFTLTSSPLAWTCDLRPGAPWLFCGHDISLDANGARRGADLRDFEQLVLTVDYHGPARTLRIHLKNRDPRYSKPGDASTDKVNKIEFSVRQGLQSIALRPSDFSVADYWALGKNLPPELGRTQLDNVVSVDLSTGSSPPPGRYNFRIASLTLRRSSVSPAQLYLGVIGCWTALIAVYGAVRARRAHNQRQTRERIEAEARAALAHAKKAAERASRAKSDFLARMSHELRTPLNAVLGYAQLLERSGLGDEHLAAVRTIHRSGRHLLSLITDILDLSKIEAGKMELHTAPMNLRAALASVADMVRVPAEEKGLAFRCVIDPDAPEAIEADEKRLRQILLNLLSNAVKFTTEGRVSLLVKLVAREASEATLRFEVQDSGPGIAEDEIDRIFRPFEQVGELERREGGTGLGLTISRQLAGLMGSVVEVQSRIGQGASFWFTANFKVADAPAAGAAPGSADIVGYAGGVRRVLVVDDHAANRDLLCDLLQRIGFETEVARDGREAVQLAQRARPDLVLMDLNMPVLNGREAIRMMRLIEGLKTVPILAVSADGAEGEASSRAAGADGFIGKPIDTGELLTVVGRVLSLDWITARTPDGVRAKREAARRGEPRTGRPALRILAAEDNPANQLILAALLKSLDVELQVVSNGADAVRAFENGDFDLVLMDVQMPGMNGAEAAVAMRRLEALSGRPRTPIVALSANVMPEQVTEYRAAGMDAHIAKPIEIEELYRVLDKVATGAAQALTLAG